MIIVGIIPSTRGEGYVSCSLGTTTALFPSNLRRNIKKLTNERIQIKPTIESTSIPIFSLGLSPLWVSVNGERRLDVAFGRLADIEDPEAKDESEAEKEIESALDI